MRYVFAAVVCVSFLIAGCTSTASLTNIQTTSNYPNKIHLRAGVVIAPELKNRTIVSSVNGSSCGAYTAKIEAGAAYLTTVQTGLESAIDRVVLLDNPLPTGDPSYDMIVNVGLSNESASIQASSGFLSTNVNAQFQTSLTLSFADSKGKQFYMYTANGTSFASDNVMSCSSVADVLKQASEKGLKQAADFISQSTFSSEQINQFAKTLSSGK